MGEFSPFLQGRQLYRLSACFLVDYGSSQKESTLKGNNLIGNCNCAVVSCYCFVFLVSYSMGVAGWLSIVTVDFLRLTSFVGSMSV